MAQLLQFRLVLLISVVVLGGCERRPASRKHFEKLNIVATVFPLGDVARQVGGASVDVSWIVESGQSLNAVELTPELRARMRSADLVIGGGATEPWASEGFSDPVQHRRVIRLDALDLLATDSSNVGMLWLDPVVVKAASRELAARMAVLRPEHEKPLRAQADAFIDRLDALLDEYQPKLTQAQNRNLLVLGTDFDRLLRRFGLQPVPTVVTSPMRLNDADMRMVRQFSRDRNTRLLIVPADTPSAVVRDLEVRGGLQVVTIDCLGSSASGGRGTYLDLMRFNLDQLLHATSIR